MNKSKLQPKKLEEHEPGATKSQVLEVLTIVALTKTEPKRNSKKCEVQPSEA